MENLYNTLLPETGTYKVKSGSRIMDRDYLESAIDQFVSQLNGVADLDNHRIYIDIKNKYTFMIAFFALSKTGASIVLVPTEIDPADYLHKGACFLSDNRKTSDGLFVTADLKIKTGRGFDADSLETCGEHEKPLYLYTSGSTGSSRLVPKSLTNLVVELDELVREIGLSEEMSWYATPPLYHIYGLLFGMLLPLYTSGTLILDYHFTPESVAETVQTEKIDVLVSIPSYYDMFSRLAVTAKLSCCKAVISSSAPLPGTVAKKYHDEGINILEIYGSTETGGIARRVAAQDPNWKLFSYVEIIKGYDMYLEEGIDQEERMHELTIISPAVSVRYNPDEGYNTGDIVTFKKSDSFILEGRNTRFVKISGKRVDLEYVSEKVVSYFESLGIDKINPDKMFTGCRNERIFILYDGTFPKPSIKMKEELRHHLPGYAVPKLFIKTHIPRNNMGKLIRKEINRLVDSLIS
jgi:acyl-coenzyme A synthetase/AMP-(fatty) acid ligase